MRHLLVLHGDQEPCLDSGRPGWWFNNLNLFHFSYFSADKKIKLKKNHWVILIVGIDLQREECFREITWHQKPVQLLGDICMLAVSNTPTLTNSFFHRNSRLIYGDFLGQLIATLPCRPLEMSIIIQRWQSNSRPVNVNITPIIQNNSDQDDESCELHVFYIITYWTKLFPSAESCWLKGPNFDAIQRTFIQIATIFINFSESILKIQIIKCLRTHTSLYRLSKYKV